MTYDESATLMTDLAFRGRVRVAALHYAEYIFGEDPNATAHNSRYKWMQTCFQNPDQIAMQIQPLVVMDPAVQNAGKDVDDATLQGAVENTINKVI